MLKRHLSALAAAALLTLPIPASAENHEYSTKTVLATVNGTEITLGHLILLRSRLPDQYDQFPNSALFGPLLQQLIDQTLLVQASDGQLTERMELILENERRNLLSNKTVQALIEEKVTDETLRAAYDAKYGEMSDVEWNASHILVETEAEALAIIDQLNGGADFATLAREKSTGPSGPNGGQLGWFQAGQMVAPFEQAVAAMEPEAISAPVQTQFGWHVIRLNERRNVAAPPIEEVAEDLRNEVVAAALREFLDTAATQATITRPGDEMDPNILSLQELLGD